jgi:tetratricopeptide (TPR) repeat protein
MQRLKIQIITLVLMITAPIILAGERWEGEIAPIAQKQEYWHRLIPQMLEQNMFFGALAASQRMLGFFSDLPSKELAFKTVIAVTDKGYQYDTRHVYISGDLDPKIGFEFANSYYLYKAIVNEDSGFQQWADYYFERIDKVNFPKYRFHKAIAAYVGRDYLKAEQMLAAILNSNFSQKDMPFVKKVARTLARIHYEKEQYEQAYDIYSNFLLRVQPMSPSDWLEGAWSLYFLKRYPEALGYLYNLESKTNRASVNVEKYIIRALIYKDLCDSRSLGNLLVSFQNQYQKIINGILTGENLDNFPVLDLLQVSENTKHQEIRETLEELKNERSFLSGLSGSVRPLAKYIYDSELAMLTRKTNFHKDTARRRSAENLINFHESLRFLTFDIEREKYNPETVFADEKEEKVAYVTNLGSRKFRLEWEQRNDFWRDERLKYIRKVKNYCP